MTQMALATRNTHLQRGVISVEVHAAVARVIKSLVEALEVVEGEIGDGCRVPSRVHTVSIVREDGLHESQHMLARRFGLILSKLIDHRILTPWELSPSVSGPDASPVQALTTKEIWEQKRLTANIFTPEGHTKIHPHPVICRSANSSSKSTLFHRQCQRFE